MQRTIHYGVIALALLGSSALAAAQQNKTGQNSADEALTRSAPEAQAAPQAPAHITTSTQASQPGLNADGPVFVDGKLAVAGAPLETQTTPAKFSEKNDTMDKTPIMAYPVPLTDQQRQAILQSVNQTQPPIAKIDTKPAELLPDSVEMRELPRDVTDKYPAVRDYKFVRLQDKVLLVNPREGIVVGEIKG